MADNADMHFQVKGSAALPYRLKAYGRATELELFCDCPGGRKRYMCKHVAALLMGDVSALVQPSDDVSELSRRAEGSLLLLEALHHRPTPPVKTVPLDAEPSAGLAAALAGIVVQARAMGWLVVARPGAIELYGTLKNGRPRKMPDVAVVHVAGANRPYVVTCRKGGGREYGHLDRAGALLLELAARHQPPV